MSAFRILAAALLFALLVSVPVISFAEDEADQPEEQAVEGEEAQAPEAEDKSGSPVFFGDRASPSWDGREYYPDRFENEFVIIGGDYLGENWKNTYYIGGGYFFHISQMLAFGAQYFYSPIVVDKDTPFYQNLRTSDTHTAVGLCMLNTPAVFKAGKNAFNLDFYFTLGAGAMRLNNIWEPTGVIGGGAKFYFPVPWIALRVDINSYLHYTTYGNKHDFSGDVALGGGISFLFPKRKIAD